VQPGTYKEIMRQIAASKAADLAESAKLPFSQKLAASDATRITGHLVLSESLNHPVLEVVKLFNQAVERKVFSKYALAGGLAVEYYGAPIHTEDADFLVVFPESAGGVLDPSSLYKFFTSQGAAAVGEYLVLHGIKFQMIPANNPLDLEALASAVTVSEKGTSFFIITLEYLIALKLRAWRYKDRLHVNHLLDSRVSLNQGTLSSILRQHQLESRWNQLLAERGT
jgi:hypothetical protein